MRDCRLEVGGGGFIGNSFTLDTCVDSNLNVVQCRQAICAGNLQNLESLQLIATWLCLWRHLHRRTSQGMFGKHLPRTVVNFAAESYVDRSILGLEESIRTNLNGMFVLREGARILAAVFAT